MQNAQSHTCPAIMSRGRVGPELIIQLPLHPATNISIF